MTKRDEQITRFLENSGLDRCVRVNLAGDASNRRYFRLELTDRKSLVFMDAPPSRGEDVGPFIRIAEYLRSIALSAPEIIAKDETNGFLILEDLGDDLFARLVQSQPDLEPDLYIAATDLLIELHNHSPPKDLAAYDAVTAADLACLAIDWYALGASGNEQTEARALLKSEIERLITVEAPECDVLVQRDYHSENLLWLPDRASFQRVGLLDFQDALTGHRSYDLVSLLQDARRDVPPEVEMQMLERYIAKSGQNEEQFKTAYALWGAQRNLRILGVFARLCMRDGKPKYIPYIPRVWALLLRDLAHPKLESLQKLVKGILPEPSAQALSTLEEKCAQTP